MAIWICANFFMGRVHDGAAVDGHHLRASMQQASISRHT